MRDREAFEHLLERKLAGEDLPASAWVPYRDRAAVLITDLSGFTRVMREIGLEGITALIHGMRKMALPLLKSHGGVLVKYEADDLFATFCNPVEALRCAADLRRVLAQESEHLPGPAKLCMGIGWGDILWWGEGDLYGEEVNLASKLGEDTAKPEEILLTEAAAAEATRIHGGLRFSPCSELDVGGRPLRYFRFEGGI
jgi:class 3 adenylate cyclase